MSQDRVDLAGIFGTVTQNLAENKQSLNQADVYNQDHGDNMVQTFETITNALQQKKGSSDSAALKYAASQLSQKATSSSGQLYAQNLAQAADQLKGKSVDAQGAMQLLQTLIGAGQSGSQPSQPEGDVLGGQAAGEAGQQQASQPGGDALSSLLGGLMGGEAGQQPSGQPGGDALSSLLGGLTGGGEASSASPQSGLGLGNLLNAGMAFLQARQSGGSNMQALVQAFVAGSGMGNTTHREQSTQMVVNSFLQALGSSGNQS